MKAPKSKTTSSNLPTQVMQESTLLLKREGEAPFFNDTSGGSAASTSTAGSSEASLTLDLARSVTFDDNNVVIRDEKFNSALARIAANESKIKTLELVSVDTATDAAAETRAKSLLAVLKEEGVTNNNAKLLVRAADSTESAEIIRSGFLLLNRGIVLK